MHDARLDLVASKTLLLALHIYSTQTWMLSLSFPWERERKTKMQGANSAPNLRHKKRQLP
jgi:hypothetical protein